MIIIIIIINIIIIIIKKQSKNLFTLFWHSEPFFLCFIRFL